MPGVSSSRRLVPLLACALTTLAAWTPAPAQAKCGATRAATPTQRAGTPRPPLVIGDSVLYNAVPGLARLGFEANGKVCRRMDQGLAILRARALKRRLPLLVILELGANGGVTGAQVDEALALLDPRATLVLLTPSDAGREVRGADAIVMRVAAMRHPQRIRVLEWASLAATHPQWMARDGVHLRGQPGVDALIALIAQTKGAPPPAPPPPPGGVAAP